MSYRWQLAIFNPEEEYTLVTVEDYLQLREDGQVEWIPELDDSALFLETSGREWMAYEWNLGDLGSLVLQFEEAANRLEKGEVALVRSGVNDQLAVPYLLLEPAGDLDVQISLFFIEDVSFSSIYPVSKISGEPSVLYQYVLEHRAHLLGSPEGSQSNDKLHLLPFPKSVLLPSLRREANLGFQLYKLLDKQLF